MLLLHALEPRQDVAAALHRVELVGDQDHRLALGHQLQRLGVVRPELAGLDHEQHDVDVRQHRHDGLVQRLVERRRVLGLVAGRVDEHELRRALAAHAGDAVARGLRLVGRDADLLADQRVQQRGLAHVRAPDDGHEAAALLLAVLVDGGRQHRGHRRLAERRLDHVAVVGEVFRQGVFEIVLALGRRVFRKLVGRVVGRLDVRHRCVLCGWAGRVRLP